MSPSPVAANNMVTTPKSTKCPIGKIPIGMIVQDSQTGQPSIVFSAKDSNMLLSAPNPEPPAATFAPKPSDKLETLRWLHEIKQWNLNNPSPEVKHSKTLPATNGANKMTKQNDKLIVIMFMIVFNYRSFCDKCFKKFIFWRLFRYPAKFDRLHHDRLVARSRRGQVRPRKDLLVKLVSTAIYWYSTLRDSVGRKMVMMDRLLGLPKLLDGAHFIPSS